MQTCCTFIFLALLCLITSCVPSGTPTELKFKPSNSVANRARSLEAFNQTVYPIVRNNTCVNCHNSATGSQSPVFADADMEKAFDAITLTNKVNLISPENSRVVLKLRTESHNCWSGDCAADSSEMEDAIRRWIALAPVNGNSSAGISTDSLVMPLESAARLSQTEHGTLLLQAEQEAYRMSVVSGRFFDLQDSAAQDGKYLSMTAIGDNPHTLARRELNINRAQFDSCRDFTAADLAPSTRVARIMAPRVHIPSGATGTGGKVVNDGHRPFSTTFSLNVIRPDKRLEYARMIYNGNYSTVTNRLLFTAAPTPSTGTGLPDVFNGSTVSINTTAAVLPHFVDYSQVFNSDGTFVTSGTFTSDNGTIANIYTLFKDGSYNPDPDQTQRNFVKNPALKRDNFMKYYKDAMSALFYSDATTRRTTAIYPYSQMINADVQTYFRPIVTVELQCPVGTDPAACVTNPSLRKYHVTSQTGPELTQANALDCYTLDAGQSNLVPAPGNCDGTDRRFFHYIDIFVRPVIASAAVTASSTVRYFNAGSPNTFVNTETYTEDLARRRVYIPNQTLEELDPDVFFTGGASVVTDTDDLENFSNTLYSSVRNARCVDCHGDPSRSDVPQFASANAGTALSVLKSGGYINMNVPASSFRNPGMIHQCDNNSTDPRYSCDSGAETALRNQFMNAIYDWKAANEADAAATGAQTFRNLSNDERLPGRAKYTFKITTAGKYNVWMRMKNIDTGTRLNFRILNASNQAMSYTFGAGTTSVGSCYRWDVNTADGVWTWSSPGRSRELASIDQRGYVLLDNNKNPLVPPNERIYFDLPVGDYILDIIGLTEGIRLDAVGVNRVENFTTDERLMFQPDRRAIDEKNVSDYRRKVLRYELTRQLNLPTGSRAFFEIEVKKQFSGQNYVFRNPRFITSPRAFNLKFRGIKVFINGKWSFPDATYNALEGISGDDRVLTYAPLVALAMGTSDLIHFQFDSLVMTTDALTPLYPKGSLPSPVQDRRCADVNYFMRNVKPILFESKLMLTQDLKDFIGRYPGGARNFGDAPRVYNCVTCHTATHPFFKMSTFLNDEEFCREALSRVDFQNFYQSLVIRGINGTGNHPKFVFVDKFVTESTSNNFKVHDQNQDYLEGRYRNVSGIASELVPGPMMIWSKADMGISATSYTSLTTIQRAMIEKNGLYRSLSNRTISSAVETYSWYDPTLHYSLIYGDTGMPDNVLTALDVINPDPAIGRLNSNRNVGPRIYDILGLDAMGIPFSNTAASGMVPFKGQINQQYTPNGQLGFNPTTIDYISTTAAPNTEAEMWADYEVQRDYYRERVVNWIRIENQARLLEQP